MQGLCLEILVVGSAAPRVLPRDRLEICWLCDMRLSHWETVILFKIEDWRSLTLVYTWLLDIQTSATRQISALPRALPRREPA